MDNEKPTPFTRQVIDALLPKGAIWKPAQDGDFDRFLNGIADNFQVVLDDLSTLAHIRNPFRCTRGLLPDLERELGVTPNEFRTENDRRAFLAPIRFKRPELSTPLKLQRALDKAGFGFHGYGLTVTRNSSPAVDPSGVIDNTFVMIAHDFPSIYCAGNTDVAYCGFSGGGYYLVSGDRYDGVTDFIDVDATFNTPPEQYWSLIFFVGGTVRRNPDGKIIGIAAVNIPRERRQELHRLILRVKPMGIWAAMAVNFV